MRQTGFYFVKVMKGHPWEIYYWSSSANSWLYNQKRYSDKQIFLIHPLRVRNPDELPLETKPYTYPNEPK